MTVFRGSSVRVSRERIPHAERLGRNMVQVLKEPERASAPPVKGSFQFGWDDCLERMCRGSL